MASFNALTLILERFHNDPHNDPHNIPFFDYHAISANPNISQEYILSHPDFPWDYNGLALNPNVNLKFINTYILKKFKKINKKTFWRNFSSNPNATLDIILNNSSLPWNWRWVSGNPNITPKTLSDYPDFSWDYSGLSCNPNFNWEYIDRDIKFCEANDMPITWNFSYMSTYIPFDVVLDNLSLPWNWEYISSSVYVTPDTLLEYPDLPWNYSSFTHNPNVTVDMLFNVDNPYYQIFHDKYDPISVSANSNITFGTILSHPNFPWDFRELSANFFLKDKAFSHEFYLANQTKQRRLFFMENVFEELIKTACTPERTPNWCDDYNENHPLWNMFN